MARSPMDALIDAANMKCTACGAEAGTCNCWERCQCGWTKHCAEKSCGNAVHALVLEIVEEVDHGMTRVYPDAMKHASGGFRRTLKAMIERVALKSLNQPEGAADD